MAAVRLNQSPAPTFSWLGVNGTERELPETAAEETVISGDSSNLVRITAEQSAKVVISGGKQPRTVIMDVNAEKAFVSTAVRAESGERIRLVQIVTGGETVLDLNAELAENAVLELVQLYLNTADCVSGITVNMNGRKSAFSSQIGYTLAGSDALDINLNIVQNGKKTASDTAVKGVLRGTAKKIFRGTIDFRNGAAGSAGTEQEHVLLLGETVVNKTVPVILCAEEDVAGTHGATIGRVDPKQIFYMQSRGIPEAQIYELLAQSQIGSVVRQIGDAETEQRVNRLLGREQADE